MIKIFYIMIFGLLGKILNSGLSSTNILKISENKKYEYIEPFIFTISFSEILIVMILTILISIFFIIYYEKDFFRIRKVSKNILWLELYFFSFIYGTYQYKLKITPLYLIILFIYFLIIYSFIYYAKEEKEIFYKKDLYKSREKYLSLIDFYLENMKTFAIIGEWGIGKTKLIENFFNGNYKDFNEILYKNKYEFIYIDVSIYSENEKIIETLQNRIGKLLKKYNFLRLEGRFIKNLFLENETFLKIIYKFLFSNISLEENKRELEEKIKEINSIKKVVICFDNLERLNNKNRIIKLFAILDEILPNEMKKIYIYDEKYMKEIFKKENDNFVEYISKYVFNKIKVEDINVDEILEDRKEILTEIKKIQKRINENIDFLTEELENEKKSFSQGKEKIDQLKNEVKLYFQNIANKLKNPRYLINLKEYIDEKEKNIDYRVEYKIIRDNFPNLELNDILEEELRPDIILGLDEYEAKEIKEKKKEDISLDNFKIIEKNIEKICQMYIFEMNDERKSLYKRKEIFKTNLGKKKIYFESYYNNIKIEETKIMKELEKYKKFPEKYLFKIIDTIEILNNPVDSIKEIIKYMSDTNKEYIISSLDELIKLYTNDYPYKILKEIIKKIKINKNIEYNNDRNKYENHTAKEWKDIYLKVYIRDSLEIKYLISIISTFKCTKEYIKSTNSSILEYEDLLSKKYIFSNNLKEIIDFFEKNFNKNIKELKKIDITEEQINDLIQVLKLFNEIEVIEKKEIKKLKKEIFNEYIYDKIEKEKDCIIINYYINNKKENLKITEDTLETYLTELEKIKKELYSRQEIENYNLLKVELLKFQKKIIYKKEAIKI
ncbi:hypothetical protein [Fusobacterium perfoetens]|uniref:hypothetical protein n=1 Tax=Fusobacterium perfoetens TaxID=852 RepID=UPI0004836ABA|nr:hypothetical protein [Fusobacterium perfoetens]